MPKTKRGRESDGTTTSRSSKRRKAAESSMAKMKEIAATEGVDEATEFAEAKEVTTFDADVEEEGEVEEVPRVVAPGFRMWKTTSVMTSGGVPSNVATWDPSTQKYSQVLDIQSSESFTLVPLVVTQGPYQGRQVFMLEPTSGFRFLDFPPEIRNLIYSFLLEEEGGIKMSTTKPNHKPRRAVVNTFRFHHAGLSWDKSVNKWINQPPSNVAILRTNKQIFDETAPVLYGNNHFHFPSLVDMKIFLDKAGDMRPYIRHIHIGAGGYYSTKARAAFHSLKDAYGLCTLAFNHRSLCNDDKGRYEEGESPRAFSYETRPLLRALHSKHLNDDDGVNVLDIIKLEWTKCHKCQTATLDFASDEECLGGLPLRFWERGRRCNTLCKDLDQHCREAEKKIRSLIAKQIGVEE